MDKRDFANRLWCLRINRRLTQQELADAIGVPVGTLRNWEQGIRLPRLERVPALLRVLECTLEQLIEPYIPDRGVKDAIANVP